MSERCPNRDLMVETSYSRGMGRVACLVCGALVLRNRDGALRVHTAGHVAGEGVDAVVLGEHAASVGKARRLAGVTPG